MMLGGVRFIPPCLKCIRRLPSYPSPTPTTNRVLSTPSVSSLRGLNPRSPSFARRTSEHTGHDTFRLASFRTSHDQRRAVAGCESLLIRSTTKSTPSASPDEMVVKVYPLRYEKTHLCASF